MERTKDEAGEGQRRVRTGIRAGSRPGWGDGTQNNSN